MAGFIDIAITGASSGLGRALAMACAKPGVTLHLAGRDAARLAEVAVTARRLGASVTETVARVGDAAAMAEWIGGCGRLDLVVANAGMSAGPGAANVESPEQVRQVVETNVTGTFNTVLPALALLAGQPRGADGWRGRIAVIGSIAGLIALPTSPAYSASKAMLDVWVTAAAPRAARDGVGLSIVRPGFIRTPMTAGNPYRMPGLMDADRAAVIIMAGLAAGRSHITFPRRLAALARLGNALPAGWLARLPNKPAGPAG